MPKNYQHLDLTERILISGWRNEQLSLRTIARRLQRSHASISRELRRNLWGGRQYWPPRAQILARARLQNRACRERLKSKRGRAYVHQQLQKGWTPELIAGRLHRQKKLPSVCHESIYQYIYAVAPDLSGLLPRHHAKRKPKRPYRKTGARIPNRTSVALHAPAATARREYGHWEADTLVAGDRQHGLNVLVERKSRLTHLSLLVTKTDAATKHAILRRLHAYPDALTQSITYDHGSENTLHEEINRALDTQSFFCAPYNSWEKGSVEQINGLIRRFFPKGTNFLALGRTAIHRVEQLLNNRPRKCLHYRTPYEVFREARGALPA
ncbi:MAG: IS30 family transposase [Nitrospirae bacterium]|nr:IS30 family transposase [Nitrospirota bacterium]